MIKIMKCIIHIFKFFCGCTQSCAIADENFMHI